MIWLNLALFVVSFILTALLAPKPQIENARPQELDPAQLPRATENAPIPLVLGRVRMNAPNTIWYGDFEAVARTEKVKTGLFSSKTVTTGYYYYLGFDLALAMGPQVVCTKIFVDDHVVWEGETSATVPTGITIEAEDIFGGDKEGGGVSGGGTFYPGGHNLTANPISAYLEIHAGTGNVPAYLGTCHMVFEHFYIGESPNLRKIAFILESYTNDVGLSNNGKIGEDINPAEAIYQIMTDRWRGMGIDSSYIDVNGLRAIGETLFTEGNGCSIIITGETDGKKLIGEILRQIDCIAYQDPESGLITFKLIRNDYDVDDLMIFDEDDVIKIASFSRSGWDEVVAQVKVTFPQRNKESEGVAVSQDMATFAMIGRLRSTTVSMPFCYGKAQANRIASRERSQLSVPLFKLDIQMNRNAHVLRPGMVFKLNWPEYGFSNLVLRVQEFDLGSLLDGKIVVKCLQDRFAMSDTVFADPEDSSWVAQNTNPLPILASALVEMPKFFTNLQEYPLPDGRVGVIPFAAKPGAFSTAFDMIIGDVSGDYEIREPDGARYKGTGTLTAAYSKLNGLATGQDTTVGMQIGGGGTSRFTLSSTLAKIREGEAGLLYVNGEWMGYTSASGDGVGNWTLNNIYRGLFGTRPLDHPIGTRVYEFSPDFVGDGTFDSLAEGEIAFYKMIDNAGRKVAAERTAAEQTLLVNGLVANRPLRPGNVQLDGSRADISVDTAVARSLTWAPRNRLSDRVQVETDAAQTPDIAETYDVDVMINGVRNSTLSATNVSSPYSVPFDLTLINEPNCEFRVYARRTAGDLRSSASYAWLPFSMLQSVDPGPGELDPHSYWRLYIASTGLDNPTVNKIEFRATAGGADQCVGGTPSASTIWSSVYNSFKAFDNDGTSFWAAVSGSGGLAPQWVAYQFPSPVSVAEVAITSRNGSSGDQCVKTGEIQWSDDGVTWNTAKVIPEQATWANSETRLFSVP